MIPGVGSEVYIQSYKHNGSIHRTWSKALVIEADKEKVVAVTEKAWVIESDGKMGDKRTGNLFFLYGKMVQHPMHAKKQRYLLLL